MPEASTPEPESTVPLLFDAAGLTIPDDELADFVAVYPQLRAGADALYAVPDLAHVDPTLTFSPAKD
jgi:hypothetical protein